MTGLLLNHKEAWKALRQGKPLVAWRTVNGQNKAVAVLKRGFTIAPTAQDLQYFSSYFHHFSYYTP